MNSSDPRRADPDYTPLSFSRWVAGVLSRWRTILLTIAATGVVSALAVFLIRPVYQARASFVPNSSAASMRSGGGFTGGGGGLGGIVSQLGVGPLGDPSESPDFYSQLIQSRELRTRLLTSRFPDPRTANTSDSAALLDLLRIRNKDPLRRIEIGIKTLSGATKVNFDDETNLVRVTASSEWPELSSQMANRILDLVSSFNREQRASRARSNRVFLESRVTRARMELESAEGRHRFFYDQNRSWRASPSLVFEEQRIQRDVDRAAELYLMLQRQLESAMLEEVNDAALITVVDLAVPPRKAQWPRFGILIMSTLVVGGIIGAVIAGSATVLADWERRNPDSARLLRDSFPGQRFRRRRQPVRAGASAKI